MRAYFFDWRSLPRHYHIFCTGHDYDPGWLDYWVFGNLLCYESGEALHCEFKGSCQGFQRLVHILSQSSSFLNFYYCSIISYLQHTQDLKLESEADKFLSINRIYTVILFQSVERLFFITSSTSRTTPTKYYAKHDVFAELTGLILHVTSAS